MKYTALKTSEHPMDKRIASADTAIEKIHDGATILMGGLITSGTESSGHA